MSEAESAPDPQARNSPELRAQPADDGADSELGGNAPCFAPDVCAECGLLIEDRFADTCPRCGTPRG